MLILNVMPISLQRTTRIITGRTPNPGLLTRQKVVGYSKQVDSEQNSVFIEVEDKPETQDQLFIY